MIDWISMDCCDPGWEGSDRHYLVVLNNKWIVVSYFFCDSYGHWWSSQWDLYDKHFGEGQGITHWAYMPDLPEEEED